MAAARKPKDDETAEVASAPKTAKKARPELTRNAFIGGVWYGPAWGNATDYPETVSVDSAPHLFDEG